MANYKGKLYNLPFNMNTFNKMSGLNTPEREYSAEWKQGDEPYYPVNDAHNSKLYAQYKQLADAERNVIFGGRLGEYRYYDMDKVITAALSRAQRVLLDT